MKGAACIPYGANSFIKVAQATEDRIGGQSQSSACYAVKYVMYSKRHARQRTTVIDYNKVGMG